MPDKVRDLALEKERRMSRFAATVFGSEEGREFLEDLESQCFVYPREMDHAGELVCPNKALVNQGMQTVMWKIRYYVKKGRRLLDVR